MSAEPSTTVALVETEPYRRDHQRFLSGLPSSPPSWLASLRQAAAERFLERGFPTPREEAFRHTSLAPLARTPFARAQAGTAIGAGELDRLTFGGVLAGPRLVFVNGYLVPTLSTISRENGLEMGSLRAALEHEPERLASYLGQVANGRGHALADLNTAFLDDGAFIALPPGLSLSEPILVCYYSTPGAEPTVSHPRTLILAAQGSQATVIEAYGGAEGATYFTNAVTEIVLADGAHLEHGTLQRESAAAFHVARLAVRQERSSTFADHALQVGAALARNDIEVVLDGEGADCTLNGLFLGIDQQLTDTHTLLEHARPHGTSRQLYKGIMDGRSRGVFHGTVRVDKDAQKTDALQTNKNLLLSREALVHSTPALEILADDVKCKHGSTTGQLDPLALFYLRSRGIGERAARALLTYAFASDVVARIKVEALRTGIESFLKARLPEVAQMTETVR